MKELYEKYKGRIAKNMHGSGIICGYTQNYLIIAVVEGYGWNLIDLDGTRYDVYVDRQSLMGYLFVNTSNISEFYFGR